MILASDIRYIVRFHKPQVGQKLNAERKQKQTLQVLFTYEENKVNEEIHQQLVQVIRKYSLRIPASNLNTFCSFETNPANMSRSWNVI